MCLSTVRTLSMCVSYTLAIVFMKTLEVKKGFFFPEVISKVLQDHSRGEHRTSYILLSAHWSLFTEDELKECKRRHPLYWNIFILEIDSSTRTTVYVLSSYIWYPYNNAIWNSDLYFPYNLSIEGSPSFFSAVISNHSMLESIDAIFRSLQIVFRSKLQHIQIRCQLKQIRC